MRTLIALGLVLCIALAAVHADTTTDPLPQITADWSDTGESVQLRNATLNDSAKVVIPLTTDSGGSPLSLPALTAAQFWFFTPTQVLANLNHTLRLNASDISGNTALYTYPFTVNAPSQSITMQSPPFGGTHITNGLNITIQTQYSSSCRWDLSSARFGTVNQYKSMRYTFNTTTANRRLHTILDFYDIVGLNPAPGATVNLSVSCNWTNVITPAVFPVVYLTTPPTYFITNSPQPIVDVDNPVTNITISADQEVWCTLADERGSGQELFGSQETTTYARTLQAAYTDQWLDPAHKNIRVDLTCENRAGDAVTTTYTILAAYDAPVVITVTSPLFTKTAQYSLAFRTNRPASCAVTYNDTDAPLSANSNPGYVFTSNNKLTDGENAFEIQCTTPQQQTPSVLPVTVVLDNKVPVLSSIDVKNPSCDLSRLYWSFNGSDEGSGVSSYNYTVKQGSTTIVNWKSTTEAVVDESGLALINGTKYTITAFPIDGANNIGTTKNQDVLATTNEVASCDEEPPETDLYQQNLNGTGVNITFGCDDHGKACKDAVWYSLNTNSSTTCPSSGTPTTNTASTIAGASATTNGALYNSSAKLNASFVLRQDTTVCWAVSDAAGNYAWGAKRVTVKLATVVETCTDGIKNNQETALDCGGQRCAKENKLCALGVACQIDRDCTSNACIGGVCATASCSDGFQNGNETGVDCGKNCPACKTEFAGCTADTDCAVGKVCSAGVCFAERYDTELCDPTTDDCAGNEQLPEASGLGLFNIILISLGAILVLSGGAYLVLHREPEPLRMDSYGPQSVDVIDQPLTLGQPPAASQDDEQTGGRRDLARLKRERNRRRLRKTLSSFESPEELAEMDEVTHREIEQAYENFDAQTFAETTKNLLEQEKVDKKDVAVALADIASKPDADHEAIADLRRTFELEEPSTPKQPDAAAATKDTNDTDTDEQEPETSAEEEDETTERQKG